jgi:tRNA threonylcarbamoyl adenosine modification protein YeaZ
MINLILDCSYGMNVYLVNDGEVYSFEDKVQNKHSDEILKVIDELLSKAKVSVKDIQNICVCVGPGSFTGVRVAVSIVKGLAIGTNAKVFALSNFDIFDCIEENYYLVLDGFSNFVYLRTVKNNERVDECVEIEKFVENQINDKLKVYYTTEKTQKLLEKYEIYGEFVKNNIISAFNLKIQNGESVNLNQIYPVYLRASQAEIEREKKKNNG